MVQVVQGLALPGTGWAVLLLTTRKSFLYMDAVMQCIKQVDLTLNERMVFFVKLHQARTVFQAWREPPF